MGAGFPADGLGGGDGDDDGECVAHFLTVSFSWLPRESSLNRKQQDWIPGCWGGDDGGEVLGIFRN